MKIENIIYPFVYTDTGERILIDDIDGNPKVGQELKKFNNKYLIKAITSDSECVNGVCPIK